MKYGHIVSYVMDTPWAILPSKLTEMLSVLAYRAAGHEFTREEIAARIGAKATNGSPVSRKGVAVIPIRGVIAHRMGAMDDTSGGTSAERISAMMAQVAGDSSIGTIVYDIDSPGGSVVGMQELAAEMFALRGQKHQIAVANGLMASAAVWLGSQAHEIVSIPSGTVGSIGVFTAHQDMSKALEKEGINVTLISAGKYKVEGSPFAPLSDDARAFIQGRVDDAYAQFTKDVARGRGLAVADVRNGYGEGRALPARDALKAGLVDRIATMDDVLGGLVGQSSGTGLRAEAEDDALALLATVDADRRRRFERY